MSISKESAEKIGAVPDRPELFALLHYSLQRFLNAMAAKGFMLPIFIKLRDADGNLLREFTIMEGKTEIGESEDAKKLYVFPITATAWDAQKRRAILRIAPESTPGIASARDTSIEFVN